MKTLYPNQCKRCSRRLWQVVVQGMHSVLRARMGVGPYAGCDAAAAGQDWNYFITTGETHILVTIGDRYDILHHQAVFLSNRLVRVYGLEIVPISILFVFRQYCTRVSVKSSPRCQRWSVSELSARWSCAGASMLSTHMLMQHIQYDKLPKNKNDIRRDDHGTINVLCMMKHVELWVS